MDFLRLLLFVGDSCGRETSRKAAEGVVGAAVASPRSRSEKMSDRLKMSESAADRSDGLVESSLKGCGNLPLRSRG